MIEKIAEFLRSLIVVGISLMGLGLVAKLISYPVLLGWGLLP